MVDDPWECPDCYAESDGADGVCWKCGAER